MRTGSSLIGKEKEIQNLLDSGLSPRKVSEKIGCTYKLLLVFIKNSGIKSNFIIPPEPKCILNSLFNKPQNCENTNPDKNIIKGCKYYIDQNFFKRIETQEQAYILGYIYSDGCVYGSNMKIVSKDYEILERMTKIMSYTNQPYYNDGLKNDNKKIQITNQTIVSDLIKLGVVPNKSLILQWPTYNQVPKYLMSHFIRGIFDGDGTICKRNKRTWTVGFIGTKEVLEGIKAEYGLISKLRQNPHAIKNNKNTYTLHIENLRGCVDFLEYMYKDATIFLDRKAQRANKLYSDFYKADFKRRFYGFSWDIVSNQYK